jgi:hypothetical protein
VDPGAAREDGVRALLGSIGAEPSTRSTCAREPSVPSPDAIAGAGRALVAISDPMLLLRALQVDARNRQVTEQAQDVAEQQELAAQAAERHKQAIEAAARAAKEASTFLGLPGWLGDIVEAVAMAAVAVIAVAATVVTGGVAGALMIAGLVLLLCAEPLAQAAAEVGLIGEEDVEALALGLRLAGSALMLGAGVASAVGVAAVAANSAAGAGAAGAGAASASAGAVSSASTATEVAKTAKTVAEVVKAASDTAQGADRIHTARATSRASERRADAAAADGETEDATAAAEAAIDDMRRLLSLFQRVGDRLEQAARTQAETREAVIRSVA